MINEDENESPEDIEKFGDMLISNINNGPKILKELQQEAEKLISSKPLTSNIEPSYLRGLNKNSHGDYDDTKSEVKKFYDASEKETKIDKSPNKVNSADNNEKKQVGNTDITKPGSRIEKLLRKFNSEYLESLKGQEKTLRKEQDIYQQYEKFTKELNSIKLKNRDEDLLKMQKENQEIEMVLHELKHQDKTELIQKEEESKRLVEELNSLFLIKKREALEKDKERKAAIEEIKVIRKQQEELAETNSKADATLKQLENDVKNLEHQVQNYENYKKFIDEVVGSSEQQNINLTHNNQLGSNKDDYDMLKEKFENLIERMNEIKEDIEKQESEIEMKKKEKNELKKRNDRQNQNQKVLLLEEEAKSLAKENELIEKEIEEIMRKNQKKESDNHRIMLSIINLYNKVTKKGKEHNIDTENMKEQKLCEMLNEIGDKLNDLIAIYKELENYTNK